MPSEKVFEPRELALGGLFGAAALALPVIFHLFSLGSTLLPMYLPLMALAFVVRPAISASAAFAVPLLSALLTGMPPWYPPVALAMAIELPLMAALIGLSARRRPGRILAVLIPVLLLGRLLQLGLHYLMGLVLELPPEFLSLASLVKTLPGIVLMIAVVPALVRLVENHPGLGAGRVPEPNEIGSGSTVPDEVRAFFDERADEWETIIDYERVIGRLRQGLTELAPDPGERILDLGCGTGVLLGTLLERLDERGRIEAVDPSPRMLARARAGYPDPRVSYHLAAADRLPLPAQAVDRVICFSVWPHLPEPDAAIAELRRVLRPGGTIHVWHVDGRERINEIHLHAGEAVASHRLEPAVDLTRRFERHDFTVTRQIDTADTYLVTAVRAREHGS